MDIANFLGTWNLLRYEISSNGIPFNPFGENPIGYITYSYDGYMAVGIMRKDRTISTSEDLINLSLQEQIETAKNFMGYSGKYVVKEDIIIHYPEISSRTSHLSKPQERNYQFENLNNLILSSSFIDSSGIVTRSSISWQRVKSKQD